MDVILKTKSLNLFAFLWPSFWPANYHLWWTIWVPTGWCWNFDRNLYEKSCIRGCHQTAGGITFIQGMLEILHALQKTNIWWSLPKYPVVKNRRSCQRYGLLLQRTPPKKRSPKRSILDYLVLTSAHHPAVKGYAGIPPLIPPLHQDFPDFRRRHFQVQNFLSAREEFFLARCYGG